MNAIFGYDSRLQLGSSMVVLTVTCTGMRPLLARICVCVLMSIIHVACFVGSLPPPPPLQIAKTIRDLNMVHDKRLQQLEEDVSLICELSRRQLESDEDDQRDLIMFGKDGCDDEERDDDKDDDKDSVSSSSSSSSSDSDDEELERSSASSSDADDEAAGGKGVAAAKDVKLDAAEEVALPRTRSSKKIIRRRKKVFYKDDRPPFILEIDEETDADLSAVVDDWAPPIGMDMVNTLLVPGSRLHPDGEGQHVTLMRRCKLSSKQHISLNTMLSQLFTDMYLRLCYNVRGIMGMSNVQILGIHHNISILDEDIVEVILSAIAYKTTSRLRSDIAFLATSRSRSDSRFSLDNSSRSNRGSVASVDDFFSLRDTLNSTKDSLTSESQPNFTSPVPAAASLGSRSISWDTQEKELTSSIRPRGNSVGFLAIAVVLTPLATIPGYKVLKYLGQIQLHFVKDSLAGRGELSMDSFYHVFITEANAIIRAHVEALHGNALVNYRVYPLEAGGRVYRNQAYYMLTLCGDAVEVCPSLL